MVRRCTGSSQRRLSVSSAENPYNQLQHNAHRVRRQSLVQPTPPPPPPFLGSEQGTLYRRSSVADLNRRTSLAPQHASASAPSRRSSELEISDKEMERLLTLYNSKKTDLNNVQEEDALYSSNMISDNTTLIVVTLLGLLAIFVYVTCR